MNLQIHLIDNNIYNNIT